MVVDGGRDDPSRVTRSLVYRDCSESHAFCGNLLESSLHMHMKKANTLFRAWHLSIDALTLASFHLQHQRARTYVRARTYMIVYVHRSSRAARRQEERDPRNLLISFTLVKKALDGCLHADAASLLVLFSMWPNISTGVGRLSGGLCLPRDGAVPL